MSEGGPARDSKGIAKEGQKTGEKAIKLEQRANDELERKQADQREHKRLAEEERLAFEKRMGLLHERNEKNKKKEEENRKKEREASKKKKEHHQEREFRGHGRSGADELVGAGMPCTGDELLDSLRPCPKKRGRETERGHTGKAGKSDEGRREKRQRES